MVGGNGTARCSQAWRSSATSSRGKDGEHARWNAADACDGPFAEAKEEVAGYDVIECADFDEAIEIASKHAAAKFGTIEIRPVWQTRRLGADP
jgi:hypothetical protein